MSRVKRSQSNIITIILVILVIAGVVGGVVYLSRQNTPIKGFSLIFNNQTLKNASSVKLSAGSNRFDINRSLLTKEEEYTVSIVPYAIEDFDFVVDGYATYSYLSERDLTDAFEIEIFDDYFTISGDFTLCGVLSDLYGGSVSLPGNIDYAIDLYSIVVTVGEYTVSIGFCNNEVPPEVEDGLHLFPDCLVF